MAKPRIVILCGAGLSAEIGLPTMASWAHCVQEHSRIDDVSKDDLRTIHIECNAILGQVRASASNLEHLASILEMLHLCQPFFKFSDCKIHQTPAQALRLVRQCIRAVYSPNLQIPVSNTAPLLRAMSEVAHLHIITTNYDMNIEIGAAQMGYKINVTSDIRRAASLPGDGAVQQHRSIYDNDFPGFRNGPPFEFGLSKLHGSVNWTTNGEAIAVAHGIMIDRADEHGRVFHFHTDEWDSSAGTQMCLVAPAISKGDQFRILASQWESAAQAIQAAHQLWIIGYSFPLSDSFMRYFVAAALRRNTVLRQVLVIDPMANQIVERTQDLFGPPVYLNNIEPLPFRWTMLNGAFESIAGQGWNPMVASHLIRRLESENHARATIKNYAERG